MRALPSLQILQPVNESLDATMNDEARRCDHDDSYKRARNPVSGCGAGTRDEPAHQADIGDTQPEPKIRDLLLRLVQLGHNPNYHFRR